MLSFLNPILIRLNLFYPRFKSLADRSAALVTLILLSPLLAIVSVLVYKQLGSPVFFSQQRPGLDGKPFLMYKFRSMTNVRDEYGVLLPNQKRLTPFGRLLRSTSIDELPALVNVLRGEMSIVGPRPLLMEYLPHYSPYQAQRHAVLPGITGWAQINGRNTLNWDKKFNLDVWYVNNQSFLLDLSIILKSLLIVLLRSGIEPSPGVSMPKFTGK